MDLLQSCSKLNAVNVAGNTWVNDAVIRAILTTCPHLSELHLDFCGAIRGGWLPALAETHGSQLRMLSMDGCRGVPNEMIIRFQAQMRKFKQFRMTAKLE
jgi:hypothetical protein